LKSEKKRLSFPKGDVRTLKGKVLKSFYGGKKKASPQREPWFVKKVASGARKQTEINSERDMIEGKTWLETPFAGFGSKDDKREQTEAVFWEERSGNESRAGGNKTS